MAKKQPKQTGIAVTGAFTTKTIVFSDDGIPWVVTPADGSVRLATVILDDKQTAVGKKK